ncbi:MAG: antirestriction protein ArdA [Clostridia bacterium]|nr:antirestriction protein ArdA [Clostridia bacterium]
MSDKNQPIRVYIENAADSTIGGFTIPLPATKETLAPWFAAIGVDGTGSESIAIVEIQSPLSELKGLRPGECSLDELNYLAAKLSGLDAYDMDVFLAALETGDFDNSIGEIINLTENLGKFDLQPAYSARQYGEFLLDTAKDNTMVAYVRLEQSEDADTKALIAHINKLESLIDPAELGRDKAEQEDGVFTAHGYLTDTGEIEVKYRGPADIPNAYRIFPHEEPLPKTADTPLPNEGGPLLTDTALTAKDCVKDSMDFDLKGRVVAVRAELLSPAYQSCHHQLLLATGGFGCSPGARGRAVYGVNLHSGERECWNRADILGVVRESALPDWARDKPMELTVKESIVAKLQEARETAKLNPPAKREPINNSKSEQEL